MYVWYTENKQPQSINNKVKTIVSIQKNFAISTMQAAHFWRLLAQKSCKFYQNNKFRIKTREVTDKSNETERERTSNLMVSHFKKSFISCSCKMC